MDFIGKHFTVIAAFVAAILIFALWVSVELFREFKADAIRDGKEDPTKVAVSLVLSTWKNVLLLRKAAKGEVVRDDRPRTSQELDATITPGTLRAGDLPKPPARPDAKVGGV